MRILVTGATGYIGSAVAEALQGSGHSVIGVARTEEAAQRLKDRGHDVLRADLTEASALAAAARAADAVVHTANTNTPEAGAVDREAVEAMLRALEGTGKPFLYTSGIWVQGATGDRVATEADALDPIDLIVWRPGVEERVRLAAREGVRSVVIRPALVYGRAGGIPAMLVGWGREQGVVRFVGSGEQRWPFVHVDDLADLYVRALEAEPGSVYLAVSGPSYPMREVSADAASLHGAAVEGWPLEDARAALGAFADALALDQQATGERARSELGWRPHRPTVREDLRNGSYRKAVQPA